MSHVSCGAYPCTPTADGCDFPCPYRQPDWTWDKRGRSNASPLFCKLCDEVERLIRSDAHSLISGNAGSTARLIMAQLAHVHGLAPTTSSDLGRDTK